MEPKLICEKILQNELVQAIRNGYYEEMIKLAVDVERGTLALGGEWHSDAAEVLARDGSEANNVWGANLYPWEKADKRVVYTSLINLKPAIGHKKMEITDAALRKKIHVVIKNLLLNDDETLPTE